MGSDKGIAVLTVLMRSRLEVGKNRCYILSKSRTARPTNGRGKDTRLAIQDTYHWRVAPCMKHLGHLLIIRRKALLTDDRKRFSCGKQKRDKGRLTWEISVQDINNLEYKGRSHD